MREIILAPSFDTDFFEIISYVDDMFGRSAGDELEARFRATAAILAASPSIGKQDHGYQTTLYGFILFPNWIFYSFTNEKIVFLHMRDGRMNKQSQKFDV